MLVCTCSLPCGSHLHACVTHPLCTQTMDPASFHTGCPVIKGIKWGAPVWIHSTSSMARALGMGSSAKGELLICWLGRLPEDCNHPFMAACCSVVFIAQCLLQAAGVPGCVLPQELHSQLPSALSSVCAYAATYVTRPYLPGPSRRVRS